MCFVYSSFSLDLAVLPCNMAPRAQSRVQCLLLILWSLFHWIAHLVLAAMARLPVVHMHTRVELHAAAC
jgi:hypothetical protein